MDTSSPSTGTPEGQWTLGSLLRLFLPLVFRSLKLVLHQFRVLRLLSQCGTTELGINVFRCDHCGSRHWAPRSCGNRHCPQCLSSKSLQWLNNQLQSLLPISYFHCVFTVPKELKSLMLGNQKILYTILFESASETLLEFGRNRYKGNLGLTAILHTWGQKLDYHPHLHCIVTGGALSPCGTQWESCSGGKFLFPVKALSLVYRGKFMAALKKHRDEIQFPPELKKQADYDRWMLRLYTIPWVTYAKRPFGGPDSVLRYLANYTHRVAISNRRIMAVDPQAQTVTFKYRDYRDQSKVKTMTLSALEFIRRFSLHILPRGLVRIRHYGILGNNRRKKDIAAAREILEKKKRGLRKKNPPQPLPLPVHECPACGKIGVKLTCWIDSKGKVHQLMRPPPKPKTS